MDNEPASIFDFTSQPPTYSEALHSPSYVLEPIHSPAPPPSYGEVVSFPTDTNSQPSTPVSPYPVLSIPTDIGDLPHTPVLVQPLSEVLSTQPATVTLGDAPIVIICPHCLNHIRTKVYYKPGAVAWGMCCLISIFGLVCGFCLIPCCMHQFQDVYHSCPDCRKLIGWHVRE